MRPRETPSSHPTGVAGGLVPSIVPSRAVLTELARGFLILNERDRGRAAQFASTFLREQSGPRDDDVPVRPRLPAVRRSARVWEFPSSQAEPIRVDP